MNSALILTVAGIHLLAVMSPGPDFALVASRALGRGRSSAILVALGIALGVIVHVAFGIAGLSVLLTQSAFAYACVKYIGAAYLIWVGWQCLKAKPASTYELQRVVHYDDDDPPAQKHTTMSSHSLLGAAREVGIGFLTNALNAKAAIYFLALFSQVVVGQTTAWLSGLGLLLVVITFAWFALLGYMLSADSVRSRFMRVRHWFERACGAFLIALGVRVATSDR
jgi:threonine/homoserine/homoserine lactone efflux protein